MSVNTRRTIETVLIPDGNMRKRIERGANADSRLCWTCGSCESECPVNIATGRLRPQKIVRMANLGMLDELLQTPEVWYCQLEEVDALLGLGDTRSRSGRAPMNDFSVCCRDYAETASACAHG